MQIILRALVVGVLVSLCCALLGVNLVLRRFSMIGDGLSHVGFGAMALAAVCNLGQWQLEFALPVVIAAAVLILRMSERSRTGGDAAIALLATGAVAIGSLLYNYSPQRSADICNSLFGSASVLTLTDKDLLLSLGLGAVVLALFVLCYHKLFAITFDETFAQATGVHVQRYKTLLAILTAVTIVLGMKLMGAIMISGPGGLPGHERHAAGAELPVGGAGSRRRWRYSASWWASSWPAACRGRRARRSLPCTRWFSARSASAARWAPGGCCAGIKQRDVENHVPLQTVKKRVFDSLLQIFKPRNGLNI